ncbi:MAG TPA: dTMP kinase [Actinomycetes bacterium]|nr:dTMP kinase [Actinomycetes bacterium]
MSARRRGLLIAFEGVEGAGKSTQLELLRGSLEELGHKVVATREPGGTPMGERVRSMLLDPSSTLDPRAEALLFAAARAQLVEQVIRPALDRDEVVLCDRYLHSSLAYQGVARGLGCEEIATINRFATAGLLPDVVVLLRLDPAEGLARRHGSRDRIECQDLGFHRRVAEAFLRLAAAEPERFVVIDAAQPAERVAAEVRATVLARIAGGR